MREHVGDILFSLVVLVIVCLVVLAVRDDNKQRESRCAKALAGVSASDSLRILRVAPGCQP